ncbi:MAG: lysylphosphatidylglycerol synthase transmembrane domain-containing protein [Nanoarchaeota archaeon]
MKIKKILPLIGLVLFAYLVYRIGVNDLIETLKGANLTYLFIGIVSTPIFILPLAYKWHMILKRQNFDLKFLYVLKLYYIGAFYGFITPSRVGSLMRATYLKKKTKRGLVECASSIILERVMDLFAIFVFAFLGALLFIKSNLSLSYVLIFSFLVFSCAIFIFMRRSRGKFVLGLIYNYLLPKNIKEKTDNSLNSFYNSLPKLRKLILVFFATMTTWILIYFQTYIFAWAFSIEIPFYVFVVFVAIGTVVATIPISISGLGTRELTLITLFSLYNIRPEAVVSMSLSSFFLIGFIEGLIGLFFVFKEDEVLNYNTISS